MADGNISPAAAARELIRRRRAREKLSEYSQAITIPGAPVSEDADEWLFKPIETSVALHQRVMMEWIQECVETDFGRLMIFAPPGSAKSSYAAVVAPTWAMGKFPGIRVLMTSYASTPIVRASKRARQICASDEYRNIWAVPTSIVKGSNAADEFELTNGSGLFAAGLLGGITSSRCDLGIIDDPVAGRLEAESENNRKTTVSAYRDDFLSRLKPKASIILIQTRWHQDDLAGSILPADYNGESGYIECRDGQTWRVLCIPAQADREDDPLGRKIGDYLWPEWFSPRHWNIFKAIARTWSSLFQQKPVPDKGIYCQREQFQRYSHTPPGLRFNMASDFATKQDAGDKTAHLVVGLDSQGELWIEDGFNERVTTDKGINAAMSLLQQYLPLFWLGEKGVIENSIGPEIRRTMRTKRAYAIRHLLSSAGDKLSKAQIFLGLLSSGCVHVKEGPFGDALIEQLVGFPGSTWDDLWDCCGMIGRAIDKLINGKDTEPTEDDDSVKPFTRDWLEHSERESERDEAERERNYR
jgi:phage terminase large subunit-like protein